MARPIIRDAGGQQIPCADWFEFVTFWSDAYYDYSTYPDTIYWHVKNTLNSPASTANQCQAALSLLGAWKTGSLKRSGRGTQAFTCLCGNQNNTYNYTGRWATGTSSACTVWTTDLPGRFRHDVATVIEETVPLSTLTEQVAAIRYHGSRSSDTRFGIVYALTYLHFISDELVPILYDQFAEYGVAYLNDMSPRPALPYSRRLGVRSFQDYCDKIRPRVEHIYDTIAPRLPAKNPAQIRRMIDRALWTFGHHLKGSSKVAHLRSCCHA